MHGQYRRLTEQPPVDMRETYGWLKAANLPAATEGLVVAAQDQALRTRDYERKILHRDVSPTCRMYCRDVATGPGEFFLGTPFRLSRWSEQCAGSTRLAARPLILGSQWTCYNRDFDINEVLRFCASLEQ